MRAIRKTVLGLCLPSLMVGLFLLVPVSARAEAVCGYLEPGGTESPACVAREHEEEEFIKRVERDNREVRELERAEEKIQREDELKEEKERKARERQEHHEAQEWAVKPKVTLGLARSWSLRLLHKQVPTWTYRTAGFLQCGGGKISRSQWRCRVEWIAGSVCHAGRIRVIGAGHEDHRPIFRDKIEYENGYGFVRHGRIRCLLEHEG